MAAPSRALNVASPLDLFRSGHLRACVDALKGQRSNDACILRIRAHIRLRQYQLALDAVTDLETETDGAFVVSRAFAIQCNAALGQWANVARDQDAVRHLRLFGEEGGELAYAQAFAAFQRGDGAEMNRALLKADPDVSAGLAARLTYLRAWAASLGRDYVTHARLLERAVKLLSRNDVQDVVLQANCAQALAHLSREIFTSGTYEFVSALIESIPWTEDLVHTRFLSLRSLAWAHCLRGSPRAAHALLHELRDVAPSPQWIAAIYADQAYLARMAGDGVGAQALLEHAVGVALATDWGKGDGEDRVALLNLIELACDTDRVSAAALLSVYDRLQRPIARHLALSHDDRLDAMEKYARGCVLASVAHPDANPALGRAYELFTNAGYAWRAAATALRLYALSKDELWLSRATEAVREFPESAVAGEIRRRSRGSDDPRYCALTGTQRRVFHLVCNGLSDDEIACELSVTYNTAKNHVAAVRRQFGVHSRSQLLAKARESGLLS
jgi:DNA-binding CsgD family transcriptional regulator